jgi:cystathionine beta-lyase
MEMQSPSAVKHFRKLQKMAGIRHLRQSCSEGSFMNSEESKNRASHAGWREDTVLAHAGLDPQAFHGFVNPPVVRASTVLHKDADAMLSRRDKRYPYGLSNTPTIEALTTALTTLEGPAAAGTVLVPSGLAAIAIALMAAVRPQTKVLIPDNAYFPSRRFGDECLPAFGAEAVYYDPLSNDDIAEKMQGASAALVEAPGSLTFEMPDVAAIVAAAKANDAVTVFDNTWATPLIYRPLEHGIDMAVYAGTKYFGGHSDLMIGSVSASAATWPKLQQMHRAFGLQAGTEEIWLTLRGLRTLSVRLERHERSALKVASWLKEQPGVARVLCPALPDDPGYDLWKRDFGRTCGLFAFVLNGGLEEAKRFLNALELFGLGPSWGGFESLAILAELEHSRTVHPWTEGAVIRLHIGLEDVEDIKADLERGLAAVSQG